jgi:hypothetical protein
LSRGLVDAGGGLPEAVEVARKLAGLAEKKFRLLHYVQRRSLLDLLPLPLGQSLPTDRILALLPEDLQIE